MKSSPTTISWPMFIVVFENIKYAEQPWTTKDMISSITNVFVSPSIWTSESLSSPQSELSSRVLCRSRRRRVLVQQEWRYFEDVWYQFPCFIVRWSSRTIFNKLDYLSSAIDLRMVKSDLQKHPIANARQNLLDVVWIRQESANIAQLYRLLLLRKRISRGSTHYAIREPPYL